MDYAERARALVGTRFRPQGRGPGGLDCVGLILSTFRIDGSGVSRSYRLRGDHRRAIEAGLSADFRKVPARKLRSGDLLLMCVAEQQFHLAVRTESGFVHAHARIRRVVETPGLPEWPLIAVYRPRVREQGR